jgi:hypothetical protein
MAILLYGNGITEEFKPAQFTFSDAELIAIFEKYVNIRSFRLYEVPNSWCLWGEMKPDDTLEEDFNSVGTNILDQPCFSPILFLHDSETNPDWGLTDQMIMMGYEDYKKSLTEFFDEVAKEILHDRAKLRDQAGRPPQSLVLEELGVTNDKKILFRFDIDKQKEEFYMEANLQEFANKVHNFLKFSYQEDPVFALYGDKNIVIVAEDNKVKPFIDKILAYYNNKENYEASSVVRNTYEKWANYKKNMGPETKKGDPKPKDESKSNEDPPKES